MPLRYPLRMRFYRCCGLMMIYVRPEVQTAAEYGEGEIST
jgi:hypothetical protein